MLISVIIPAHNESAVIDRCLRSLVAGASTDTLEVIVVANGCKDDTADRARAFGPIVRVVETSIPSKSNALNLGDRAATSFPRFFVDADITVTFNALRAAAECLNDSTKLVAAPAGQFDTSASGPLVRAFYNVWTSLPYVKANMIGSGVYGVSEAGRRRFDSFPAITADDAFVRLQFTAAERVTAQDATFTVRAPRSLRDLIKIKTRAHFGNLELVRRYPALFRNEDSSHGNSLAHLTRSPTAWPRLSVYLFVRLASRLLAYRRFYFGDHSHWERDQSSRVQATSDLA